MADVLIRRGDDEVLHVAVTDANGAAVPIGGAEFIFTAKRLLTDTEYVVQRTNADGITITSPAGGLLDITIPASTTELLDPGTYDFDVQMTLSGQVSTIAAGTMLVRADATV